MFTAFSRQLDADIKEDFLVRIGDVFGVERAEASQLYNLLLQCMDHRQSVSKTPFGNVFVVIQHMDYSLLLLLQHVFEQQITIFDSESEDQMAPDAAILTTTLKGTYFSPLGCDNRHFSLQTS